jgi:hypothetical protein
MCGAVIVMTRFESAVRGSLADHAVAAPLSDVHAGDKSATAPHHYPGLNSAASAPVAIPLEWHRCWWRRTSVSAAWTRVSARDPPCRCHSVWIARAVGRVGPGDARH